MILREREEIIKKIEHAKVRMRGEDWIRIPFMFLFILIGFGLIASFVFNHTNFMEYYSLFFGVYCVIYVSILLYKRLYVRKKKLLDSIYFFTDQRLIFYIKSKNLIEHSFEYNNFPEFTYWESPYNNGYIIIGRSEGLLVTEGTFPFRKTGINLAEDEIVLDNLSEVKKEYDFLKACIEKYKK